MSRSLFRTRAAVAPRAPNRRKWRRRPEFWAHQTALVEDLEDRTLLTTTEVDVINDSFSPKSVPIHVGDTIHWVWKGSDHSTTSVAGSAISWDSGVHNAGFTYDVTFGQSGTFNYYCKIHGFDNGNGTAGGMSGTITVTANVTLTSIAVTPADPSVPAGETEQFKATGTYSDNSTADITSQVTWASSATSVATISNSSGSAGLAATEVQGSTTISATLGSVAGNTTLTVTPAVLQSIAVTPASPSVPKGETEQFIATGTYSDNSTQILTTQVAWGSSSSAVATISNVAGSQGLATAVSFGTSSISAALTGISGSTTMTVSAAALISIAVTPASPSVPKGETQQFTATGTYSDNSTSDITSQVAWSSSATAVATISNSSGSNGLASALKLGSSTITAVLNGVSNTATMTVVAAALQSVAIAPMNPNVPKGEKEQFRATGTYSDGSTADVTSQVNWSSSATGVATISNAAGSQGQASTLSIGTSTITAALSGFSASTTLTVIAAALQSIAVTPANPTVAKGETEQFTATGTFSDSSTADITAQVNWTSSATAIATISNTQGSQGLASALAAGNSTITAALNGVSKSTTLTVSNATLQSIAIAPADPSVPKGKTEQFTATGTFSDNTTADITTQVDWTSSAAAVATISNTAGSRGLASTLAIGNSTITATLGSVSNSTTLTVGAAALQSIGITPANPIVTKGQNEQFTATATYSDGSTADVTAGVTWASSAPSVATISNAAGSQGLASTQSTGDSTITAALDGVSGSTTLTVGAAVLESIAVTPANPDIAKGDSEQFTATGKFSDNSTSDITTQVNWASSATGVATISNTQGSRGLAATLAIGHSTITAGLDGVSGATTLTVSAAVLRSISVTPANPSVPKGETRRFTATGTFSDQTTADISAQVTWTSSSVEVAAISNAAGSQGTATALTVGSSTITATSQSISGTTTLRVSAAVLQSIAVTPANPTIAKGENESFVATGTLSDLSTRDVTSQVEWSSSNHNTSTISNTPGSQGVASAVAQGQATINAMLDGISGSTTLTVTAAKLVSILITPTVPDVPDGELQVYKATGTLSDNTTEDLTNLVTWASANQSVATISNDQPTRGVATSLAPGTTAITASLDGVTGRAALNVGPKVLEMIMISPTNPTITTGGTEAFMAMGMFSDESLVDYTARVTWSSSATGVVTISNDPGNQGLATAHAPGTSTISATFEGMSGITSITVTAAPPPLVEVASIHDTLNKRHQVTGITVDFSGAVNAAQASSVAIYRLATPGKQGSFDAKNAKLIKLKSAVYDAALDQVVLTPKKPFALSKPVQLRVNGQSPSGLQDTAGRLIDGNHDGQPGGNAVAIFSRKGVTLSAIPVSMGFLKSAPPPPSMSNMGSAAMPMTAMDRSSIENAVAMSIGADPLSARPKVDGPRHR
jgi:plastocyanin